MVAVMVLCHGMAMIVAIIAAMVLCYGMAMVVAMIAVMGKRSDNNSDGHGRAE